MVALSFSDNQVSVTCRLTSMFCLRNFHKDKPSKLRKPRYIILSAIHVGLRGEKRTKEKQRGLEELLGLDSKSHLGNYSDQMISENGFKDI